MEKNNKKKYLVIGIITLVLITVIGITYSFFTIGDKQELANTFTSGCLNISIENESNAINLSNVIPVTDVEGLSSTPFTFNIKNTCSTSTNYKINLESLNQVANSLSPDYIKASINSDSFDNIITKLSDNNKEETNISNSYESHNLYVGSIEGNTTKTFNLRLWLDYDATKEQAASKTYTSKINVIANPDYIVEDNSEIKFNLEETTMVGTLNNVTSVSYCKSDSNVCNPTTPIEIIDNKIRIEMEVKDEKQIVCTKLNNKRVICSEPKVISLCPEGAIGCKYILANANINSETPDFSQIAITDEGVFKVNDETYGGTSYYWRGAPTDNYFEFGGYCWRIVRINGDGTIRLIYDGTSCHANGTSTADSIAVTNTAYNTSYNRSEYVGYTYGAGVQRTLAGTNSTIKTALENWYNSNLSSNADKIADGKYCNDRNMGSGYTWSSQPGSKIYYAGYDRLYNKYAPTLSCNSDDVYTLKVGLITADEVEFAGGKNANNSSYYLYNGQNYWPMTPCYFPNASVFYVAGSGNLAATDVYWTGAGVRPVINLKADLDLVGEGSITKPYKTKTAKDQVLENKTIAERTDFSKAVTENTTGTIYTAQDDDGTSYYYAGAVDNNWVSFAGKYWRIIRINGDESIRLIYNGTTTDQTGAGTQTTTSAFNSNYNDNAYVGFMYGSTGQSNYAATHTNTNSSTIKGVLDSWYTSNLASHADKIDRNAGFCNDRKVDKTAHSSYQGDGYGTTQTGYAPWGRVYSNGWKTTQTPSLTCSQANDLFTATSSSKGNKKLTNPIGLITSDEVVFGGGFGGQNNTSYYLYTNQNYWTMSPSYYNPSNAYPAWVFAVNSNGYPNNNPVYNSFGVRPVINLKADTLFSSGDGTLENPYIVK